MNAIFPIFYRANTTYINTDVISLDQVIITSRAFNANTIHGISRKQVSFTRSVSTDRVVVGTSINTCAVLGIPKTAGTIRMRTDVIPSYYIACSKSTMDLQSRQSIGCDDIACGWTNPTNGIILGAQVN
ncbi:MAG: hypothetical protein AB8I56_05100 [Anaerolineales bacterium]